MSLGQTIGIVLLSAYAAVLVTSALPDLLLPVAIRPVRDGAFALLERIRMRPGQAVFLGELAGDLKIHAWCPIVLGSRGDGLLEPLYRPTDECFPSAFVWRRDRYYQTFQELLNVASRTWTEREGKRVNAAYSLIADYFCHSSMARSQEVDRVSLVEHRVFKNYSTGETSGRVLHVYSWSCSENAPLPRPWDAIPLEVALGPTVP